MKYGESAFDILYLLFAVISGFVILRSAKRKDEKQMGLAVLILGCGDAFHLVPRVLNYFVRADFTAALGIGKLITSVTMTVFYLLLYHIWQGHYQTRGKRSLTVSLWALTLLRVALCLLPQNGWLENSSDMVWGILQQHSLRVARRCGLLAVFPKKSRGSCLPECMAVYSAFVSVLYSGRCWRRSRSHAGNADAAQNSLLYPSDRCFPAFCQRKEGLPSVKIQNAVAAE